MLFPSWGVCGCTMGGRNLCCDGTTSPTCACIPPRVYGCTDPNANNYNANVNTNDGTCTYDIVGCMDKKANNYNEKANIDDKSCIYEKKEEELELEDLKEEKEEPEETVKEENTEDYVTVSEKSSTESNDMIGTLGSLSLGAGGYAAYTFKKKEEERKRLEELKKRN